MIKEDRIFLLLDNFSSSRHEKYKIIVFKPNYRPNYTTRCWKYLFF